MKSLGTLILVLIPAAPLLAADMVRVRAMFLEAAADTVITKAECDSDTVRARSGVTVLGAPTALTRSGNPSRLSVDESKPAIEADPAVSSSATNGLSLRVLPRVEGDIITFAATATVRRTEREETTANGQAREFSSYGYSFSGSSKSGESILLRSKGVHNGQRLSLYLVLTKESDQ